MNLSIPLTLPLRETSTFVFNRDVHQNPPNLVQHLLRPRHRVAEQILPLRVKQGPKLRIVIRQQQPVFTVFRPRHADYCMVPRHRNVFKFDIAVRHSPDLDILRISQLHHLDRPFVRLVVSSDLPRHVWRYRTLDLHDTKELSLIGVSALQGVFADLALHLPPNVEH